MVMLPFDFGVETTQILWYQHSIF